MKPYYEHGCVTLYREEALDFLREHTADLVVLDPPLDASDSWLRGIFDAALLAGNVVSATARAYAQVGLKDARLHFSDDLYDKTQKTGFHHNSRPQSWVDDILARHKPASVLDPFCGSGIFLMTCLERSIPACGNDIDDGYVRGVRERLVEFDLAFASEAVGGDPQC